MKVNKLVSGQGMSTHPLYDVRPFAPTRQQGGNSVGAMDTQQLDWALNNDKNGGLKQGWGNEIEIYMLSKLS